MATVATVLNVHGLTTFKASTYNGILIHYYDGNGKTQSEVKTAIDELQLEVDLGNTVLGGVEPDYIMIKSLENEIMVIR